MKCETPGWEGIRVQVELGAIDAEGPKDIAKALEMKDTIMSRKGVGFVAASGSGRKTTGRNGT